ncbi:MAG: hypothetical protein LBE70_00945, partial [Nitrososphaerota archaeon]|nr:hypothetical protein [Nitrososphaerota archaeon]
FCYIFGDGVPVNLQKATDLLREADEHGKRVGNIDPFADFVLCKLVNLRLLLELCKRGQGAFVGHVLSDTTRMTFFMEATATWKANGHNIKVGTDFIMPSVYDVWKQVFGSVYDDSQYHNPKLLEWTRYFHYKKGVPKDGVIWPIFLVAIGLDEARKVYRVAIDCLVEMTKAGFSIY